PKWFGSGFARLHCADSLMPLLRQTLSAGDWQEREQHLSACYRLLAEMHNALGITDPLPTEVTSYYDRPFKVIHGDQFAEAIVARITDEQVKRLPQFIGGIDQWVDSTDVLAHADRGKPLKVMYEGEEVS
ncbi:MAG: hypothetical protein KF726_27610, partial [Anaerolineae bacterium]|nr:hypothetical protein [Anaerolineae bacterium]